MESVREFYNDFAPKEWERLTQDPYHRLEFETTIHFLEEHLPDEGLVLDAGGGPGRYTIELARRGHEVVLLDMAPENLELAREKIDEAGVEDKVQDILEGSITDLSQFDAGMFDAVLCLGGPLSHVESEEERRMAADELIRVAKKDSPIFVSVLGLLGVLLKAPRYIPDEIEMSDHFERLWKEGDDYKFRDGETYAHFFRLDELRELFSNIEELTVAGLEGLGTPYKEEISQLAENETAWQNWMEMHYEMCTREDVAALSAHILLICRKN